MSEGALLCIQFRVNGEAHIDPLVQDYSNPIANALK